MQEQIQDLPKGGGIAKPPLASRGRPQWESRGEASLKLKVFSPFYTKMGQWLRI